MSSAALDFTIWPLIRSFMDIAPQHPYFQQRLLGIDYGEKVTGLAVFCPGRDPFPQPYGRSLGHGNQLCQEIAQIIQQEEIDRVVLGLPLMPDGQEGRQALKVRFGAMLEKVIAPHPLHYHDETLTTEEAINRMKNSPRFNFKVHWPSLDAWSAAIILEDFVRMA